MRFNQTMLNNINTLVDTMGDFAEFGVFKGGTFIELLPIARNQRKYLHGFDSFRGLAEPSEFDQTKDGKTAYYKGKFNTYGSYNLINQLFLNGYLKNVDYYLWEGFIPDTFKLVPTNIKFSFCYVDLDHYEPTKAALNWLFPRLSRGGIILCDDYYANKTTGSASKAIKEFVDIHENKLQMIENKKWINYSWHAGQISYRKIEC